MVCCLPPMQRKAACLHTWKVIFKPPVFLAGCVCVCLGPEASVSDEIRAMCQAVVLSNMLSSSNSREATGAAPKQQSEPLPLSMFNCLNVKNCKTSSFIFRRSLGNGAQESQADGCHFQSII